MPRLKQGVILTARQKVATKMGDPVLEAKTESTSRTMTALERYRYERAREVERERIAAERVALWAQGYRLRLARRIASGFHIPKSALAGTGLHVPAEA